MAEQIVYVGWICGCNERHGMGEQTCSECGVNWKDARKIVRDPGTGEEREE